MILPLLAMKNYTITVLTPAKRVAGKEKVGNPGVIHKIGTDGHQSSE